MMFFSKLLKEKRGLPSAGGGNGLVGSLLIGWEKSGNGCGRSVMCPPRPEGKAHPLPSQWTVNTDYALSLS